MQRKFLRERERVGGIAEERVEEIEKQTMWEQKTRRVTESITERGSVGTEIKRVVKRESERSRVTVV